MGMGMLFERNMSLFLICTYLCNLRSEPKAAPAKPPAGSGKAAPPPKAMPRPAGEFLGSIGGLGGKGTGVTFLVE
jgi:hypothetical protein